MANRSAVPVLLLVAALSSMSLIAPTARAETPVSGHITSDTEWTLAGSPYVMTTSVTVDEGATLTIEPGVVVQATSLAVLNVLGVLRAVGTPSAPINFVPTDYEWGGINFSGNAQASEGSGDTRSAVSYVMLVKAAGIRLQNGMAPSIDHNVFLFSRLSFSDPKADLSITNNAFVEGQVSGNSTSNVRVLDNDFYQRPFGFTAIQAGGGSSSARWDIHGNDFITATTLAPTIYSAAPKSDSLTIDATDNWWGTTDPVEIQNRIHDGEDDPNLATIEWDPPSGTPNTAWSGHERRITFRMDVGRRLVGRGTVTTTDGFPACYSNVVVDIRRRGDDRQWYTVKSTRTDEAGNYRVRFPKLKGRYHAQVTASATFPPDGFYCSGRFSTPDRIYSG